MRAKSPSARKPAKQVVKDIRRAPRRRGEPTIADTILDRTIPPMSIRAETGGARLAYSARSRPIVSDPVTGWRAEALYGRGFAAKACRVKLVLGRLAERESAEQLFASVRARPLFRGFWSYLTVTVSSADRMRPVAFP